MNMQTGFSRLFKHRNTDTANHIYIHYEAKRTLFIMTRLVWLFSLLTVLVGVLFEDLLTFKASLVTLAVSGGAFLLMRYHRYILSAWLMSLLLMAVAFFVAYMRLGIFDGSILLLPIGVTFAGLILPLTQIWYTIFVSTSLAVVLSLIHAHGDLPNQPQMSIEIIEFTTFPMLVFATQLLVLYTTHRLRRSLYRTQKEKQRWQTIFQSAQDGMLIVDEEGKVIDVNPILQGWLGPFLQLGDTGWVIANGLPFTPSNHSHDQKVDWEIPSHGSFAAKICEVLVQSIQFQDEQVWMCIIRDVTEDRALRAQILQEDTIKIMGKLSTTIAHDLNNHLASILALSDILQTTETESERQELAHEIGETALRAGKRTAQILSSVRNNPKALKLVRPGRLMKDLHRALKVRAPESVTLEYVPTNVFKAVLMDRTRVFDAVFNMGLNALDAVGYTTEPTIRIGCTAVEGGIYIWVEDNGVGMTEEELTKVKEAFYTTKPKGTGLGLFSVEMCAAAHGGRLHIQSTPDNGSLFQLFIPAKSTDLTIEMTQPIDLRHLSRHQQPRILLVEDNEHLGAKLKQDLERADLSVHWVTTGREAIAEISQQPEWDVLIIDFRLPDQSGLDVLNKMSTKLPPTIAISGDVASWDASSKEVPIVAKVSKPFRVGEVLELIHSEVLQ